VPFARNHLILDYQMATADYSESRKKALGHNRVPTPFAGGPKSVLDQPPRLKNLPFPALDEDQELSFQDAEQEQPKHERKPTPFINLILPDNLGKKSKFEPKRLFDPIAEMDEDAETDLELDGLEFDFQKSRLVESLDREF
jgi:hypothetical protein